MTNEEIQKKAELAVWCHVGTANWQEDAKLAAWAVARAMRELVSQAYEEAARIVEESDIGSPTFPSSGVRSRQSPAQREQFAGGRKETAERIRALKDSLMQEPVAST